jgi:RNA polymerase subunit RPABC4/transcription elongation factor Spt4
MTKQRGKKQCENCKEVIGARTLLCGHCGYHFPEGKVRKDLLEEKAKPKEAKTYASLGRGRKQCSNCDTIVGAVTKICPNCQSPFQKKVKAEPKPKKQKEEKAKIPASHTELFNLPSPVIIPKLTPKQHAERILGYGTERATALLKQSKGCWLHVDWNIVREGIGL